MVRETVQAALRHSMAGLAAFRKTLKSSANAAYTGYDAAGDAETSDAPRGSD